MQQQVFWFYVTFLLVVVHFLKFAVPETVKKKVEELSSKQNTPGAASYSGLFARNTNVTRLVYNNETAALIVQVQLWPNHTGIDSYEVKLFAAKSDVDESSLSCTSDVFIPHSSRVVLVNCESNNPQPNSNNVRCVNAVLPEFNVEFYHVYTGYYCLMVVPHIGTNSRRHHQKLVYLETNVIPVDISEWNTTFDLQPMHQQRSILVSFTNAEWKYQFEEYLILLLQVHDNLCANNGVNVWSETIRPLRNQQHIEIEFHNKSEGNYCAVVTPVDERCLGTNIWTIKRRCPRYSDVKSLKAPSSNEANGALNAGLPFLGSVSWTVELWVIILVTLICFLLLTAIIVIIMVMKKTTFLGFCYSRNIVEIHVEVPTVPNETAALTKKISVVLLYSRDHPDLCQRVANLRKILQSRGHFTVHDYGDELQWESVAVEGVRWLPNRMFGKDVRIILVHSQGANNFQRFLCLNARAKMDEERRIDEEEGLLSEKEFYDREFYQGLQLLFGTATSQRHVYQRIYSVRFTEIELVDDVFTIMTPFTCFHLPVHLEQLIYHLQT